MYFQQIYDKSLSQNSYFIGCQQEGKAVIIDPKRDVDSYLAIAREQKMKITHILETHIHADFLSGSPELAALTGADLYLSEEGGADWQYQFKHEGLRDGHTISVGNLVFEVMHTPGHTPESISFLLTDKAASPEPVMLFSGDFVFVGDIGRPDLLEKAAGLQGTQEVGAHQMFLSLRRFSALPPHIQVWPAHGAGSACGKALGAVPSSTTGYEMLRNWAFRFQDDEQGFVDYLLSDQPEPPKYFAMMKLLNKQDRHLHLSVTQPKALTNEELITALQKGYTLIDTRDNASFAAGYIPGSLHIQANNHFNTWAGWFLDYKTPFVLIAEPEKLDELSRQLMRIGLDNLYGYIPSVEDWVRHGGALQQEPIIPADAFERIQAEGDTLILDLRNATEYKAGHIKGANHIFVGELPDKLDKLPKDKKIVIHCRGGDRAAIGYSILARNGFTKVLNFSGGMNQWQERGGPVVKKNRTK